LHIVAFEALLLLELEVLPPIVVVTSLLVALDHQHHKDFCLDHHIFHICPFYLVVQLDHIHQSNHHLLIDMVMEVFQVELVDHMVFDLLMLNDIHTCRLSLPFRVCYRIDPCRL